MSELLSRHGFKFQKKFGQNFLTDPKIPARIAESCTESSQDGETKRRESILEIGPGAGILTKELSRRFERVTAVEIDESLIPVLDESLCDCQNTSVILGDIMEINLLELYGKISACENGSMPVSVCANLPYYITTPILMKLIESGLPFSYITVMVQKEVARRLVAKPKSADYGAITAVINLYGEAKKLFDVNAGSFYPRPNVDSAVVRIKLDNPKRYSAESIKKACEYIKAAFGMRRKTLSNALYTVCNKYDKKVLAEKISECLGCSETVRGEELSAEDYVRLAELL